MKKNLNFLFIICFISNIALAQKSSLDTLIWKKRLVILSIKKSEKEILQNTLNFKKKFSCQFKQRNLQLVIYVDSENFLYNTPPFLINKNGVWLIGYDGSIKAFFRDSEIDNSVFELIDSMPIRIEEMKNQLPC